MPRSELALDALVLTLCADDGWLHAGTVAETIEHAEHHRREGAGDHGPDRVDFFDVTGRRLEPVVGHDLVVRGFVPASGRPAPARVKARVNAVLDRAEEYLEAHPGGTGRPWPAGRTVPRPNGSLADVVERLRASTRQLDQGHAAGWFHNLLHAIGV